MPEEKIDGPTTDTPINPSGDGSLPPASPPELEDSFIPDEPRTKDLLSSRRSQNRPFIIVLAVVVGFFVLLMIYDTIRSRSHERALQQIIDGSADSSNQPQAGETEVSDSSPAPAIPSTALPDDVFTGVAPLMVKEGGAVVSEESDPELAGLADALNQRIRVLHGIRTRQNGDVLTESATGNFFGFRVSSVHSHTPDQVVRDEITVSTPSRGTFVVKDRVLDSVRRTDHAQILKDLENAGFMMVNEVSQGKGVVEVKLRWREIQQSAMNEELIIGDSRLGRLRLGAGVGTLAAQIPQAFNILKRQILVENDYIYIYKIEDVQRQTPLFYVYEEGGKVAGIEVVNDRFKTTRGIGIGSSVGEMRMVYTGIRASSLARGLTFLFFKGDETKFVLAADPRIDVTQPIVPFDVKIVSILIGKSPYLN